jgi:hypothetical protein
MSISGCKPNPEGASGQTDSEPTAEIAANYAKGAEARSWLADPNHGMFEAGKEATLKLVDALYAAGAEGVRVTDASKLDKSSPMEVAATLVYKLPPDPAMRSSVIKVHNETFELEGDDLEADKGQDYGEIVLD